MKRGNPTSVICDERLSALKPRRALFVDEYLVDLRARDAAIRAGYTPGSAHVTASRLLAEPKVRKAISQELTTRYNVSKESIIDELAAIAFARLGDYVSWTDTTFSVRPARQLTAHQRKAVVMIRQRGPDGPIVEVRLANRLKALELLAKVLGLLNNTRARKG